MPTNSCLKSYTYKIPCTCWQQSANKKAFKINSLQAKLELVGSFGTPLNLTRPHGVRANSARISFCMLVLTYIYKFIWLSKYIANIAHNPLKALFHAAFRVGNPTRPRHQQPANNANIN